MENDFSLDDIDLSKFLEISNDSDSDFEEVVPYKKPPEHVICEKINGVSKLQLKSKFSYEATSQVLKLMNDMPHTTVKLPTDARAIRSIAHKKLDYNILVMCEKCNELNEKNKSKCACGQTVKIDSKKNNFIVHFGLVQQIHNILYKFFDIIINYLNRVHEPDIISDIDDGELYKNISKKYGHLHILPITMNFDGAQIFKSSKNSLWPVQLYLNFLPPNIRFHRDNIIISSIYFGAKKPNIDDLLYPLGKELDELYKKPITIFRNDQFYNFQPMVVQCVFDLPARAQAQCFKGPTGKNGCSVCHHPGVAIKNLSNRTTIRYVKELSPSVIRTHTETLLASQELEKGSVIGITGQSALFIFDDINIIHSIPTDYMHNVLLGVTKDLIEIWLAIKRIPSPPYDQYKIKSVAARHQLEQRILKLKPHSSFHRKPRSIFEVRNFKAVELQNCLFYYLRYALVGLLPTRVVRNFELLSAAIYILCQNKIETSEVERASEMLIQFADEFENIYGPGAITMNLHILRHYGPMVRNCGPLWSYSMFGFESNIGHLKNYVCGTSDVLNQIAHKYSISSDLEKKTDACERWNDEFYQQSTIFVKKEHLDALEIEGVVLNSSILKIWRRARVAGEVLTSIYANETKSIDYFVQCKNGRIGKIVFFFEYNIIPKLLLHIYEKKYQNYHWCEISKSDSFEVCATTQIEKKLLYFNVGSIEYITNEPNSYAFSSM